MAKRAGLGLAAVAAVALAAWWLWPRTPPAAPSGATGATAAGATAGVATTPPLTPSTAPSAPSAPSAADPPSTAIGFRRLTPAARRALMDRIARARTGGPSASTTEGPPAPAPLPGTLAADQLMQGIVALMPAFKDCYAEGRDARTVPRVQVTFAIHVIGEPDVGTVIDAAELDGDEAFRADPELATCLRETMLAVELPPLAGASAVAFKTRMILADEEPDDAPLIPGGPAPPRPGTFAGVDDLIADLRAELEDAGRRGAREVILRLEGDLVHRWYAAVATDGLAVIAALQATVNDVACTARDLRHVVIRVPHARPGGDLCIDLVAAAGG